MRVFIVFENDWENRQVKGVFDSSVAAEKKAEELKAADTAAIPYGYHVEEHELHPWPVLNTMNKRARA